MEKDSTATHLRLGKTGEDIAARFLESKGIHVLYRNWRCGHLEIDIIGEKDGQIIFVEVKTRRTSAYGGPEGAITSRKKKNLVRSACFWLKQNDKWSRPCRFDVLCLVKNGENFSLEHYPNAFDISPSLDYSHSSW